MTNQTKRSALVVGGSVATVAAAVVLSAGLGLLPGANASDGARVQHVSGVQASTELRRLAGRVERLPDDTGKGRYAHVVTETWYDSGDAAADPLHVRKQEWFADDYSGRWAVDTTPRGRATEHETGDEPALEVTGGGDAPEDHRFAALPTSDAAFATAIREEVDGVLPFFAAGDDGTAEDAARYLATHDDPRPYLTLAAIAEKFAGEDEYQPRTPRERAAVLRYLATLEGTTVSHDVTDAAGRRGIAVTLEAPTDFLGGEGRQSKTLIFDGESGQLLSHQHLTGSARDHETVLHTAEFTDDLG